MNVDLVVLHATVRDKDGRFVLRQVPLGSYALRIQREEQDRDLADFGVRFDVWKEEGSLHTEGWVGRAVDRHARRVA